VAAAGIARLGEEGADLAGRQAVGEEVEVVEADERPELERGVDASAHRQRDHRVGPRRRQGGDVRPVLDVVGEPHVALPVAREVHDVGAGQRAPRDLGRAPRVVTTSAAPSRAGSA
jgi:hypothetical protein